MIVSVLNLLHHSRTVLEADLVGSSHLSGGSLTHTVQYLVKHINLLLTQRIFKGDTELVELIGERKEPLGMGYEPSGIIVES